MTTFTLFVTDTDRRRRHPLSVHTGLSATDARQLTRVYQAVGYLPSQITTTDDTEKEAA